MKLEEFKININIGGAVRSEDDRPKLSDVQNLKILNISEENHGRDAMIELEDGKKVFIGSNGIVQEQCLKEMIEVIQRDYLNKELKEIIDREFCLARRIK